ncbi:MAG: hypothetical protein LBF41_06230, partial [Deltaproteobacteria bacterium]|nr:hypothetical protein [Deltaproteobacteria bacterium]
MKHIDLDSISSYGRSAKTIAQTLLKDFADAGEVEKELRNLNLYPGLENLSHPDSTIFLGESEKDLTDSGKKAVIEGRVVWEHTAAGEATRLDKGPKFFLEPRHLADYLKNRGKTPPPDLYPLNLGRRHLAQLIYEIRFLAWEAGLDPEFVLSRQNLLVVASEEAMPRIFPAVIRDLKKLLPLENIWFMTQPAFHGLDKTAEGWDYDLKSPKRLHNHGFVIMQKTMDKQVFYMTGEGTINYFSRQEFFRELEEFQDLVSYNIEDLDYLTSALDFESIGLAMEMRDRDYGMMMEVLPNNPVRPVRGGLYAHDPGLEKDVVVESFRLKDYRPEDIKYLNKNFNHYLEPAKIFQKIKEEGLYMPLAVKDGFVYFQPVQGD